MTSTPSPNANLTPQGLNIQNLSYSVPNKHISAAKRLYMRLSGKRTQIDILRDVSIHLPPGSLNCIMGSSGSGKSSLLECIMNHRFTRKDSTKVEFNGSRLTRRLFRKVAAHVEQRDILLGSATVHETFEIAAKLQGCPRGRVHEVERLLGLLECRNTKIGNSMIRGISGGEKRRVSLGLALLNSPELLLLDEINSGLDYFTSAKILSILMRLAHEEGKTIVATLHQPSADVFFLFDNCVIMDKGRVIYNGTPQQMVQDLSTIGYPVPEQVNPADFVLQLVSNPFMKRKVASVTLDNDAEMSDMEKPMVDAMTENEDSLQESSEKAGIQHADEPQHNDAPYDLSAIQEHPPLQDSLSPEDVKIQVDSTVPLGELDESNVMTRDILAYLHNEDIKNEEEMLAAKEAHRAHLHELFEKCRAERLSTPTTQHDTLKKQPVPHKKQKNRRVLPHKKILLLTKRFAISTWRDPLLFWSELTQYILLALFIGLLYFRPSLRTLDGLNDRVFSLFFIAIGFSYVPSMVVLSTFPEQRELFLKERRARLYDTFSYFAAYNLIHVPIEIIFPIISTLILYWMVGLNDQQWFRPLITMGILILCQLASESLGLIVSAVIRTVDVGVIALSAIMIISQSFAGNLVKNVSWWWIPFQVTSVYRYTMQAMAVNEFSRRDWECQAPGQFDPDVTVTCTGEGLLKQTYSSGYLSIWENCLILFGMVIILRIICFLLLRFKKWNTA